MTTLDAATQPGRLARSGVSRAPAPPPRRGPKPPPATVPAATVAAVAAPAPTFTLARPRPVPDVVPVPRRRRTWIGWLAAALAAGLVTGGAVAALGVNPWASSAAPDTATIVATVQRLGTVALSPQRVTSTFTVDDGSSLPGLANRVTYQAVGTDSATVALGSVRADDVQLVGGVAHLTIPAAQLTAPVLDTGLSSISRRDEGFLTKEVFDDGIGLSELHAQARSELATAAGGQGLAATAERLAVADATGALRRAGITDVTVMAATGS